MNKNNKWIKFFNFIDNGIGLLAGAIGTSAVVVLILGILIFPIHYAITTTDARELSIMEYRSFIFILGLIFVPRVTLLVSSIWFNLVTGGFFWWLTWLFAPRYLIAGIASAHYWDTNPFLVVCSWVVAILGSRDSDKDD